MGGWVCIFTLTCLVWWDPILDHIRTTPTYEDEHPLSVHTTHDDTIRHERIKHTQPARNVSDTQNHTTTHSIRYDCTKWMHDLDAMYAIRYAPRTARTQLMPIMRSNCTHSTHIPRNARKKNTPYAAGFWHILLQFHAYLSDRPQIDRKKYPLWELFFILFLPF